MLVDWFTVGAQLLNFLILVWLMKRFLYKPILQAMDARENRIAKELVDADAKKAEAQKELNEFQHKNEQFDQQRAALLSKATEEAKAERVRLLDVVRTDADALRAKRQEMLQNEQRSLCREISRWTQKEVFAIARKTLTDLAATSLEERMSEMFIRRLRALPSEAKTLLATALKSSTQPARLRSAFDLPPAQQAAIQHALNETFSAEIHLQFETVPELISGIEFTANGQKVAWSIADYLATLERSASELLPEDAKPDPTPIAESSTKTAARPEPTSALKSEPMHVPLHNAEPGAMAPQVEH